MRKYKKASYSSISKRSESPQRFISIAQTNAKHSLKMVSLNEKKKSAGNKVDRNFQAFSKRSVSNLFLKQIQQVNSFPRRVKTQYSQQHTLFESIQISTPVKFINQNEFEEHSDLVEYFSKNVFSPSIKFKRFSNILKSKYNRYLDINQNSRHQKGSLNQIKLFERQNFKTTSPNELRASATLSPRMSLTRRPSTGIAMKRGGMLVKKRRNSINESVKCRCIDAKHIETLKCSQKQQKITRQSCEKARNINLDSNCIFLKRKNEVHVKKLKVRGQHLQSIDPWDVELEKMRNLADMEIIIKI